MESLYGKEIKVVPTLCELREIRKHPKLSDRSKQDILMLLERKPSLAKLILSMVEETNEIIETGDIDKTLRKTWEGFKLENIFVYQYNNKTDMDKVLKQSGYISIELAEGYCTGVLVSLDFCEQLTRRSISMGRVCYGYMKDNKQIDIVNHSCLLV